MARVTSVAGGGFDRTINGALSSMHLVAGDVAPATLVSRSSLRKFTSLGGTFALHTFPTIPNEIPTAGLSGDLGVCFMNPDPLTDVSGANQPIRVEPIVCVTSDGWAKSFSGSQRFLTFMNSRDLRLAYQGEFTWQVWLKHHEGALSSIGLHDWVSLSLGQSFNNLFECSMQRDGSGNFRIRVEYMTGSKVNHQTNGSVVLMNQDESDATRWEGMRHHLAIVGVVNGGTGFREWRIYWDGVLEETLFPGAIPAEGGELVFLPRFGMSGSTDADCDFDWPTLTAEALSTAEVLEDYNRGKRDCDGSVAPPDIVPPTVDNFDPAPGSPVVGDQTIAFDVKDDTGLFCKILVVFSVENAPDEFVHDGASFRPLYADESTVVPITDGFRYTCKRRGGWPSFPTLRAYAIDAGGNEAA